MELLKNYFKFEKILRFHSFKQHKYIKGINNSNNIFLYSPHKGDTTFLVVVEYFILKPRKS